MADYCQPSLFAQQCYDIGRELSETKWARDAIRIKADAGKHAAIHDLICGVGDATAAEE